MKPKNLLHLIILLSFFTALTGYSNNLALEFDGNDYLKLHTHNTKTYLDGFTIEANIKYYGLVENRSTIFSNIMEGDYFVWGINQDSYLFVEANGVLYESEAYIEYEECLNVALSFDGNELYFYVNGDLQSAVSSHGLYIPNEMESYIGVEAPGMHNYFAGMIDEFRLWSQFRDDIKIINYQNSLIPVSEISMLKGYLPIKTDHGIHLDDPYNPYNYGELGNGQESNDYAPTRMDNECWQIEESRPKRLGSSTLSCTVTSSCSYTCNGGLEIFDNYLNNRGIVLFGAPGINNYVWPNEPFRASGSPAQSDLAMWNDQPNANYNGSFYGASDHISPVIKNAPAFSGFFNDPSFKTYDDQPANKVIIHFEHNYATNMHFPADNYVELKLPRQLQQGSNYTLSFYGTSLGAYYSSSGNGRVKVEILTASGSKQVLSHVEIHHKNLNTGFNFNGWRKYTLNFNSLINAVKVRITPETANNPSTDLISHFFVDEVVISAPQSPFPKNIAIEDTTYTIPQGSYSAGGLNDPVLELDVVTGDTIAYQVGNTIYVLKDWQPEQGNDDHPIERFVDVDTNGFTYVAFTYSLNQAYANYVSPSPYNAQIKMSYDNGVNGNIMAQDNHGISLTKYDACGGLVWKKIFQTFQEVSLGGLQVTGDGHIFMIGDNTSILDFGNNVIASGGNIEPAPFLVMLDANGIGKTIRVGVNMQPKDLEIDEAENRLYFSAIQSKEGLNSSFFSISTSANYAFIGSANYNLASGQLTNFSSVTSVDATCPIPIHIHNNYLYAAISDYYNDYGIIRKYHKHNLFSAPLAASDTLRGSINLGTFNDLMTDDNGNVFVVGSFGNLEGLSFNNQTPVFPGNSQNFTVNFSLPMSQSVSIGYLAKYNSNLALQSAIKLNPSIIDTLYTDTVTSVASAQYYQYPSPWPSCDLVIDLYGDSSVVACIDIDTTYTLFTEYAEVTGNAVNPMRLAVVNGDVLVVGNASSLAIDSIHKFSDIGYQTFVSKYDALLNPLWMKNTWGSPDFAYGFMNHSADIELIPGQNTQFMVVGTYKGDIKHLDKGTVNNPYGTGVFVTLLDDLGSGPQFRDIAETVEKNKDLRLLEVYPNPSLGLMTLISSENAVLELYDLKGRIINRFNVVKDMETALDISSQPGGIYILHAQSGSNHEVYRIIKK